MARRRFFADAVTSGIARVQGNAGAHLARVLRAEPGQEYELAWDGAVYLGRVEKVAAGDVMFAVVATLAHAEAEIAVELGAALFKFDRWEWMVEKAVELGVTRIWPLTTRRTEPHLAAAAGRRNGRWRQIARAAAEQSRRCRLPEIAEAQSLEAFLALPFAGARILLHEEHAGAAVFQARAPARLLAGPEGGWAPGEAEAALGAGYERRSLGPRILRCETAALAALARLQID